MKIIKEHEVEEPFFSLLEFNTRRLQRGATAAKVQIDAEGDWLWMSKRDLKLNIKEFGDHPVLARAIRCYDAGKLVD